MELLILEETLRSHGIPHGVIQKMSLGMVKARASVLSLPFFQKQSLM